MAGARGVVRLVGPTPRSPFRHLATSHLATSPVGTESGIHQRTGSSYADQNRLTH
jgi:hypothetical protein